MAVTLCTLTFRVADLIGASFNPRRTRVWIETNVPGDVIIDAAGNSLYLGNGLPDTQPDGYIAANGVGQFTGLIATNSTTNPTAWQYQVWVEYDRHLPQQTAGGAKSRWSSGWFSLTASADLADVVAEQYVPPTWMTTATATLQGYVDQGKAYRDDQALIAGLTGEDTAVAALIDQAGPTPAESAVHAALSASYAARWKPNTAYTAGDVVVSPSGRVVERVTSGTSGTTYTDTNWRGVRIRVGERGFPAQDPSGYTKISLYHDTSNGMVIPLAKVAGDSTDVNIDGAINGVKHGKDYVATLGYADTVQYYTLAGSAGTILGNNNFVELGAPPYTVPGAWTANGFVRFELGPVWPDSERMRLNNQGDLMHGTWSTFDSTQTASQSGTTVTKTVGPDFSVNSVGKFIRWQGKNAWIDRITAFIDVNNVTVETSRTVTSQTCRQVIPSFLRTAGGIIETVAGLKVKTRLFQTGNLQEWQDDGGLVMGFIDVSGKVRGVTLELGTKNGGAAKLSWTGSQLIVGAAASADGAADVNLIAAANADKVLVLKAFGTGQSGNMFEVQDSAGTAHIKVTAARPTQAANLVVGSAALATTAIDGFIYAPSMAGTPSGTPGANTGTVPFVVDTSGSKLWAYIGGAWKSVTLA